MTRRLSRRQFVVGVGSIGLVVGCLSPSESLRPQQPSSAQAPPPIARLGLLLSTAPNDGGPRQVVEESLRRHGYVAGQNLIIESRSAEGQAVRLPELAAELVRAPVDLILAVGEPAVRAARDATPSIPIVIHNTDDPVAAGIVVSLARPGGNVTGVTSFGRELVLKRLELLKDALPHLARVAVISLAVQPSREALEQAAATLNVQLQFLNLATNDLNDLESAVNARLTDEPEALLVTGSAAVGPPALRIVEFAGRRRLPTMWTDRRAVVEGGLMSYGASLVGQYRRMGDYAARILQGAKPADLPIEQPMRFDLVVNMKTARALGVTFPHEVALQITEVIE